MYILHLSVVSSRVPGVTYSKLRPGQAKRIKHLRCHVCWQLGELFLHEVRVLPSPVGLILSAWVEYVCICRFMRAARDMAMASLVVSTRF